MSLHWLHLGMDVNVITVQYFFAILSFRVIEALLGLDKKDEDGDVRFLYKLLLSYVEVLF